MCVRAAPVICDACVWQDVKRYEDAVAERTNRITAIKEGRAQGRIEDIPQVSIISFLSTTTTTTTTTNMISDVAVVDSSGIGRVA